MDFTNFIPWGEFLKYLGVALAIAATIIVALALRSLLRRSLAQKMPKSAYMPLEKAVVYGIVILGVIAALSPLGVDLTGLILAGGIIGIVIGFASQTVVANLISGIFIYLDKALQVGDPVSVENIGGNVVDISLLSTKIRSWDGYLVRVPNDKLFNSIITNYSKTVARRIAVKVSISYSSSIDRARETIVKALEEHPMVLVNPPPEVFVDDLGDHGVILTVRCWAPTPEWFATKKEVLEIIKKALDEAGIEIPFPQLDLHIRDGGELVVKCPEST